MYLIIFVTVLVDSGILNVLALLSVVCSASLMKQQQHQDGCDILRQVHNKFNGKCVKTDVSKQASTLTSATMADRI